MNRQQKQTWNHTTPVVYSRLFDWPSSPGAIAGALGKRWVTLGVSLLSLSLAIVVYRFLVPDLDSMRSLASPWVLGVFLRNLLIMTAVAGSLHWYLYTIRGQGKRLKYDPREEMEQSSKFTFRNQLWDNVFWSLAGGATVWSVCEVLCFWGVAHGVVPTFGLREHPVAFVAWLLFLPILQSSHFYFVHRLLHWPPLYKKVHRLHHRNINIGPWSGMAMHPVEQVLYVSSVLVHFVIPSHPVIFLVHLYTRCLGPAFSHAGFEKLLVKDRSVTDLGDFHHQLHHRFFECNYGTPTTPWDRWFGTDHDGSDEATARTRERQRRMNRRK